MRTGTAVAGRKSISRSSYGVLDAIQASLEPPASRFARLDGRGSEPQLRLRQRLVQDLGRDSILIRQQTDAVRFENAGNEAHQRLHVANLVDQVGAEHYRHAEVRGRIIPVERHEPEAIETV